MALIARLIVIGPGIYNTRCGVVANTGTFSLFPHFTDIDELGSLTSGKVPGRQSGDEITVCDLTGTGVQDTAIAALALTRARESGLGTDFGE